MLLIKRLTVNLPSRVLGLPSILFSSRMVKTKMQLMCIGDIAIADKSVTKFPWAPPVEAIAGDEVMVLYNWELPIGKTVNPFPRTSGPRLLSHPNSFEAIRSWAPGFASLANNHILDAGKEG